MSQFLEKAFIQLRSDRYLGVLIILAPLLNFLSGINIDLYTPSLPAIADYFSASIVTVKNTITITMIGFAVGCIIFGALIDILGRRRVILFGLTVYTLTSLLALLSPHIGQLMVARFIQGMMAAIASIGGRSIVMDNFKGHELNVALLYTSIAYALGPIIAPFIGGILQYYLGWKSNFFAYAVFAVALLIIFLLYVNESLSARQSFSIKATLSNFAHVFRHLAFMSGVLILVLSQVEFMVYPTVGAFLVENILHRSSIVYGNTALLVSCGYLFGTLINRFLIKRWHLHHLTNFGFIFLILSLGVQILFAFMSNLNLFSITFPIVLIGFSNGFIFGNTMARCFKLFPNTAGIAIGLLSCLVMGVSGLGIFLISHIDVTNLIHLTAIFSVVIALKVFIFMTLFSRRMKEVL